MAGIRLCSRLSAVNRRFPAARDTIYFGEGDSHWPGKVVPLRAGYVLWVEASWVDSARVWRITTNSPALRTLSGLRVGSTIRDARRSRDELEPGFAEGIPFFTLRPSDVLFSVDSASEARLVARYTERSDPLAIVGPSARIRNFTVAGRCDQSGQPPN
jgi:hypothetical protein